MSISLAVASSEAIAISAAIEELRPRFTERKKNKYVQYNSTRLECKRTSDEIALVSRERDVVHSLLVFLSNMDLLAGFGIENANSAVLTSESRAGNA